MIMFKAGDYIKTEGKDLKKVLAALSEKGYGAVVSNYKGTWVVITSVPAQEGESHE